MNRINHFNHSFLILSLAAFLFVGCEINFSSFDGYSFNYQGETVEEYDDGTFEAGLETVRIENRFGNIKVIAAGEEGPGYHWDVKIWADDKAQASSLMEEAFLDVQTQDARQTITLVIPDPAPSLNGIKSNFVLRLPPGMNVELSNKHGDLEATDIENQISATNRHGAVSLKNLTGQTSIEHAHGDLTAIGLADSSLSLDHGNADISSVSANLKFKGSHGKVVAQDIQGELELKSSHMRVEVSNVAGDAKIASTHDPIQVENTTGSLEVSNSHGRIEAIGISGNVVTSNSHSPTVVETSGESVAVTANHGAIELTVTNPSFQLIEAKTSHNKIHVALPADVSAAISLNTTHGSVESDIESDQTSSKRVTLNNEHGDIRVTKISTAATDE